MKTSGRKKRVVSESKEPEEITPVADDVAKISTESKEPGSMNSYELANWLIQEVTRHHGRLPVCLQGGQTLIGVVVDTHLEAVVLEFTE